MVTFKVGTARRALTLHLPIASAGYGPGSPKLKSGHADARPLYVRVLAIVASDGTRLVVCAVDLHSGTRAVADGVALATGLAPRELLLCGTHNHNGPSRIYGAGFYDRLAGGVAPGPHPNQVAALTNDIAGAVNAALANREDATLSWRDTTVLDVATQRSREAFTPAPAVWGAPGAPGEAVATAADRWDTDPRLPVLVAHDTAGSVLGTLAVFACHNTAMGPQPFPHPDFFGLAMTKVEADTGAGVALLLSGASGDISPLDRAFFADPAAHHGIALATTRASSVATAWKTAVSGGGTAVDTLATAHASLDAQGLIAANTFTPPTPGLPMLGGAEDQRSTFFSPGLIGEGTKVETDDDQTPSWPKRDGLQKVIGALGPFMDLSLHPTHPLHLVRLGDRALVTLPGEPTLHLGERLASKIVGAITGLTRAVCVGYTNDYIGYLTTAEAYERQQYEGASTLYGRHTEAELQNVVTDLISAL